MTLLHEFKKGLRRLGIDLSRYRPAQSADARLHRLLQRNGVDVVVDVGANDGGFARSIRAAGFRGPVLSFEPLVDAHARLQIAAVRDAQWHVLPRMALGQSEGCAEINIAGNSTSSSLLPMQDRHLQAAPHSHYVGRQTVDVQRLDAVSHPALDSARALHLKIDTQGYEMPVLRGATGLLHRTAVMQLELSLVPLYVGQELYKDLIDWVFDHGFELCGVLPGFVDENSGRMLQMDGLFARPI